jgi:hypothetical protein
MEHYPGPPDAEALEALIRLAGRHTLTVELLARTAANADLSLRELLEKLSGAGFNLNAVIPETVTTAWHDEPAQKLFFEHLLKVFEISGLDEEERYLLAQKQKCPQFPGKKGLAQTTGHGNILPPGDPGSGPGAA